MTSLRVACLGAGFFAQFHYDSWARMDRVQRVGACDLDLGKARSTGLPAFDGLETMLEQTTPDVLDIILPPPAHAQAIRTALDAGIKTIICQKPFCTNLQEAQEMAALAAQNDAQVIVHENFRFQPWYRSLKRALDDDAIGKLHQVTFRLRPGDGQGPNAYLDRQPYFQTMKQFLVHETAVHWIDTFRYLLGNPSAVYADLRRVNPVIAGEDAGYILFDHPNGVRALFDGNRSLDHAADNHRRTMGEMLVEGASGTIQLRGDGSLWQRGFRARDEVCLKPADTWDGFGGDCVHALQSHVVVGLLDGTAFENTAQEYLRVINIEEAVYRSATEARKITLGAT
jgi:predicted dehydrogenase